MFKVKVFTIGKVKENWLLLALNEYEKRLKKRLVIEWILCKKDSELEAHLQKEKYIALDPKGELLTSEVLSEKLFSWGLNLSFVIGGAEGLSPLILKKASFCWSLSPLIFTHQMTRLILVEQLYRALEIEKKSGYHK